MSKLDDPFLRKRIIQYFLHHGNFNKINDSLDVSPWTVNRALDVNGKYYRKDFAEEYDEARQLYYDTQEQEQTQEPSTDVELFNFEGHQVRNIMIDNEDGDPEPWFLAGDICGVLDLENVSRAVDSIDADEKQLASFDDMTLPKVTSGEQNRQRWFLNEDGVYELVMRSNKPEAKKFRKWLKQVIKSIRKTGSYSVHGDVAPQSEKALIVNGLKDIAIIVKGLKEDSNKTHSEIVETRKEVTEFRTETKEEISTLRTEFTERFETVETNITKSIRGTFKNTVKTKMYQFLVEDQSGKCPGCHEEIIASKDYQNMGRYKPDFKIPDKSEVDHIGLRSQRKITDGWPLCNKCHEDKHAEKFDWRDEARTFTRAILKWEERNERQMAMRYGHTR